MSENELIEIKSPRFDDAKKDLQDLASKFKVDYYLAKVETYGGLFDWFDHKVTGAELNSSLNEIQKVFMNIGTSLTTVQGQFEKVYTMCDALDNDYIHRIIDNLRLANKGIEDAKNASYAAKLASADALSANKTALAAHEKLQKNHDILALTVEKLQEKSIEIDDLENLIFETKAECGTLNSDSETTLAECEKLISESKVILEKSEKIIQDHELLKNLYDDIESSIKNLQKDIETQTLDLLSEVEKKQTSNIMSIKKVQFFLIGFSAITFCLSIITFLFAKGIL